MRVSSRSSSNTLLLFLGTGLLLVAIVILITGGFVVDLGPLHLSLRRWPRPLLLALAALALARWRGDIAGPLRALTAAVERHATATAIVLAAATAGCGIAFGTYAASGADAGGYIGAAQLFAARQTSFEAPLARRVGWADATSLFSPLGFRQGSTPGRIVPGYPPGLPLTMAAMRVAFGDFGPFLVAPLLGAVAVLASYVLGARMHSRAAGVIAAALTATSPILSFEVGQAMSDVPVAGWWTLALALGWQATPARAFGAGLAAGAAVLTRPNLLPLLLPLAALVVWSPRQADRHVTGRVRLASMSMGLVPSALALLLLQRAMYGSSLSSGYGANAFSEFFSLANIAPNIRDYTFRLLVGEGPALTLLVAGASALLLTRRHGQDGAVPLRAGLLCAAFAGVATACYLPYGVFPEWWYLRFLLPALPAAFVIVGIVAAAASTRMPVAARGMMVAVVMTVACAANVVIARGQQAFVVRVGEARYQQAGRYLDAMLPPNAVVITSQQSASVHAYTGLPVLRWDLFTADFDDAVAELVALGRRPVVLVEDWERPLFAARFPSSAIARLDWTPQADFGDPVRVGLYDPAQRGQTVVTDRVH